MQEEPTKVTGNCPKCGAAIYSVGEFKENSPPKNVYSCDCRNQKNKSGSSGGMIKHGSHSNENKVEAEVLY